MENEENKNGQEVKSEQKFVIEKTNKKVAIMSSLAAIVILALVGILYYFCVVTKPINVYKHLMKSVVDEIFLTNETTGSNDEKIEAKFDIDATLNMNDQETQQSTIVKLINSIDLGIDIQIDGKQEQAVLKLDSTYDKERLLDVSMFVDSKNNKAYLYAKDLLDSYLEFDLVEQVVSENTNAVTTLELDAKAKRIIKEELANIITEDMCSKEDGAYILRTTNIAIATNLKNALENLKTNNEFLNCFENKDDIIETLEQMIKECSTEEMELYTIEIRLYLDLLLKLQKVTLSVIGQEKYDVMIVVDKEVIIFTSLQDNKKFFDGKITITESDETNKVDINLNIVDVGSINVKLDAKYIELEEIEKVDTNNIKKFDELDMLEIMVIMSKLENSKLGEVINDVISVMTPQMNFEVNGDNKQYDDGMI